MNYARNLKKILGCKVWKQNLKFNISNQQKGIFLL